MVTVTKINKFCILFFVFIFCLTPLTGTLHAQDLKCEAGFSVRSDHGWFGWQEILKPSFGIGPRVQNDLGFIFINGGSGSYQENIEHLIFEQLNCNEFSPNFLTAQFSFNNSAVGGRLFLDNGNITCLDQGNIGAFSSDELVIITLRDNGASFIGGFVGDLKLLGSDFVDERGPGVAYSVMGLMKRENNKIHVLAYKIIRKIYRFSTIRLNLEINEMANKVELELHWVDFDELIDSGLSVDELMDVLGIEVSDLLKEYRESVKTNYSSSVISSMVDKSGLIYIVGTGLPCTSLSQREIAVKSFRVSGR